MLIEDLKHARVSIYDFNGDMTKEWFVGFHLTNPVSNVRSLKQVRLKINYFKKKSERYVAAKAVMQLVEESLKKGWNPHKQNIKQFLKSESEDLKQPQKSSLNFEQAMSFALSKGKWAVKTVHDYSNAANIFSEGFKKLKLSEKSIQDIDKKDMLSVMEWLLKNRPNWSNISYNKNKIYISALFSILEDWELVGYNIMKKIKTLPTVEPERKYIPLTDIEKRKIQEHLYLHHYHYMVYLMTIYHTGMRPKEVLLLQIKDVHLNHREIVIKPDMNLGNSKTKRTRYIPINNELYSFFREMELERYPSTFYVFGSIGLTGISATDPRYFTPQKNHLLRDTATKLWNTMIKNKETGLGIEKYQYAMKHTGADDKILAGVSLDALRSMYGHSSTQMTERYITQLKEINKRLVIDLSPSFINTDQIKRS